MGIKFLANTKFRTLMVIVAISCYIFVSFAQTPLGSSSVKRVERDENGEVIRPQKNNSAVSSSKSSSNDTSSAPLVDYDADVMVNRGDGILRLIGNTHFHHNGTIIQCDSAFRYDDNRMEFFGKVVIQKDSAFIYGDRVNYDERVNLADVFAPIVKMTQGSATLYCYNLQFNTKTNIGVFVGGGVLSQKNNLMESQRGSFDGKAEYVRFLDSVAMRNEDYKIKTDSLGYDFNTERVDFLGRTYIWSNDDNFLMADYGNYFTPTKSYLFTSNAYVMTPDNEMWADTMRYITDGRRAYMYNNVQLFDSTNKTLGFGDWGYYDDSLGRAILTATPSVRTWDKTDTSYMRADTIMMLTFDAGKSKLEADAFEEDSVTKSEHNSSTTNARDTTVIEPLKQLLDSTLMVADSTLIGADSTLLGADSTLLAQDSTQLFGRDSILMSRDSIQFVAADSAINKQVAYAGAAPEGALGGALGEALGGALGGAIDGSVGEVLPNQSGVSNQSEGQNAVVGSANLSSIDTTTNAAFAVADPSVNAVADTSVKAVAETTVNAAVDTTVSKPVPSPAIDTLAMNDWVEFPFVDRATKKPASQLPLWEELVVGDLIMIEDSIIADTFLISKPQYLEEARLAREKARRDSIKMTEKEKVMRAYHKVRMWSQEYQGVCDSTVSFSVDSTAVMYGEPILWSKANQITAAQIDLYTKNEHLDWADFTGDPFITQEVIKNDTLIFNQATGKRLETYFTNDELDYAYMSGNVQNIYYMDEDREVVAMANITCAELTILFENREPTKMIWQGQGEGPIFPIEKIPAEEPRFLEGFSWQDSLRPKSALEICRRQQRDSQRTQCSVYQRPTFRINEVMDASKAFNKSAGLWSDRTDIPNVTPEYFTQRNQQLLF